MGSLLCPAFILWFLDFCFLSLCYLEAHFNFLRLSEQSPHTLDPSGLVSLCPCFCCPLSHSLSTNLKEHCVLPHSMPLSLLFTMTTHPRGLLLSPPGFSFLGTQLKDHLQEAHSAQHPLPSNMPRLVEPLLCAPICHSTVALGPTPFGMAAFSWTVPLKVSIMSYSYF